MRISTSMRRLLGVGALVLSRIDQVLAANGGSFCTNVLCVGATISGGNTFYALNTSVPFNSLGWMAVWISGFGTGMVGSPMVILWPNADGTITLSQVRITAHAEPQVVSSPARVASLQTSFSTLTGSAVTLTFSMPSSGQTNEDMIYALSTQKPGSSDPAATLVEHNFKGTFQLDLTQTVPDLATPSATGTASATGSALPVPTQVNNQPFVLALTSTDKKFIAHGVLSALGFCFFLPIGVLQARFLRIWWPMWFKTHWIVQAGLAGPCIVAGFALGVKAVAENGGSHFGDKHMVIGLVLFLLYALQAVYGLIIHLVKSPNRRKRPIQNYGHAILGLGIMILAMYQVWLGFNEEWAKATGRTKPKRGLRIFWIVWVAILGGAYALGLALLPKQYESEAEAVRNREKTNESGSKEEVYPLSDHR
ncbi:cytochrome b561 domain-containing protein [Ceratobasidium sp. AG-Ba]|nr:cytochrome b561 domain-containing protein [Ceratobasidium sp. AG-Ba]